MKLDLRVVGIVTIMLLITFFATAKIYREEIKPKKKEKELALVEEKLEVKLVVEKPAKVYRDLTHNQLVRNLNKSLKSSLKEKGNIFASYSLQKGVDPYVAVAIALLETGCAHNCSKLVSECNNVGGQHGYPRCGNGKYARFNTVEEGIMAFIDNLSVNYVQKGLVTPEQMNKKYASSNLWATKVNNYVNKIIATETEILLEDEKNLQ